MKRTEEGVYGEKKEEEDGREGKEKEGRGQKEKTGVKMRKWVAGRSDYSELGKRLEGGERKEVEEEEKRKKGERNREEKSR